MGLLAGGPPIGKYIDTSTTPTHDSHFAVQTLSRFGLAYLLASSGTLKDTWVSVCAPAGEKGPAPDVEDLELRGAAHRDKWMLGRVLGQAKQDSALGDAIAVVSRIWRSFVGISSWDLGAQGVAASPGARLVLSLSRYS